MFTKTISSLFVLSMLHTNVAFSMEDTDSNDEGRKSPVLSTFTKTEEDVKPSETFLEKCKRLSSEEFVAEMGRVGGYQVFFLEYEERFELDGLIRSCLKDKNIPVLGRFSLISFLNEGGTVKTVKNLFKEARDQSLELSVYEIAKFIEFANNDPEVIEIAKSLLKTLLKTPEQVTEISSYLDHTTLVDLMCAVMQDENQPQEVRMEAFNITYAPFRKSRDLIVVLTLDNGPLHKRIEFLETLQVAPPAASLKKLLKEAREQSLELSSFQVAKFIEFANNDLEIIESAKSLLKTPA